MNSRPYVSILLWLPLILGLTGCKIVLPFMQPNNRGQVGAEILIPAKSWFTTDEILMIPLSGLVSTGDLSARGGEPGMLVAVKDRLNAARDNPRIKAVVLRIDTPGGTVTAADLIHREIMKFKQETKLPVIGLMGDMTASGGVYIAMAADEIYALPTTVTGSIGVIAIFPNIAELGQKIGLEVNAIKSGANKDAGSLFKKMSSEEQKIFQELVDTYYKRFLDIILKSRPKMNEATLRSIADGRVFVPEKAIEAGLIDGVMYPDEIFDRAKKLAGLNDAAIVSYEYPYSFRGNIYASADKTPVTAEKPVFNLFNFDLSNLADQFAGARFMYLWMP